MMSNNTEYFTYRLHSYSPHGDDYSSCSYTVPAHIDFLELVHDLLYLVPGVQDYGSFPDFEQEPTPQDLNEKINKSWGETSHTMLAMSSPRLRFRRASRYKSFERITTVTKDYPMIMMKSQSRQALLTILLTVSQIGGIYSHRMGRCRSPQHRNFGICAVSQSATVLV